MTRTAKHHFFANLHRCILSLKNGRLKANSQRRFRRQIPRNRLSARKAPVFGKAGLRYETTSKYDDNPYYDMAFKPARLSLFSIRAQRPRAKLPSTQEVKAKLKKNQTSAGELNEKYANKYDDYSL